MSSERWKRIEELFHRAFELNAEERTRFLQAACHEDESVRREVESLVANLDVTDSPLKPWSFNRVSQGSSSFEAGRRFGPYEIQGRIGSGGCGEVYKARDTRLKRSVALKFLRKGKDESRFQREMRGLATLNHPNIVTIHDFAEVEGERFLVTEFIEGETIRQKLSLGCAMSVRETLDVALQIADALHGAHESSIIHRDIKPENIMVRPDGYVKVLDFGLLKTSSTSKGRGLSTESLPGGLGTEEGVLLGTASYMSPEQLNGEDLDCRSDIFSFGAVIYEMITGRKAFDGETLPAIVVAILRDEPLPIDNILSGVPANIQMVVARCLHKAPGNRFQTVIEIRRALEDARADLVAGLAPVSVFRKEPPPSIAVLPFANFGPDNDGDYFGDGLADELIDALSRMRALRVISRTSSFALKGRTADLWNWVKRLTFKP